MGAAIAFPCANVILDEIAGFDALGWALAYGGVRLWHYFILLCAFSHLPSRYCWWSSHLFARCFLLLFCQSPIVIAWVLIFEFIPQSSLRYTPFPPLILAIISDDPTWIVAIFRPVAARPYAFSCFLHFISHLLLALQLLRKSRISVYPIHEQPLVCAPLSPPVPSSPLPPLVLFVDFVPSVAPPRVILARVISW
jgi:hypothetical protein